MSSDSLESEEDAVNRPDERDESDRGDAPDKTEFDTEQSEDDETVADLAAQVELLAEENRRLRTEYVRLRRTTHRWTALGLFAIGALAVLGGTLFSGSREVLFALGGTGLFAGLLTYYLTPEQFVAAETGERVYAALAATGAQLVAELGLRDDRIYAPTRGAGTGDEDGARSAGVRLFVPQDSDFAVPDRDELDSLFVVTDDDRERGVALSPTGGGLYREFESAMVESVEEHPAALADQLADALAEGFELVESASADADLDDGGRPPDDAGQSSDDAERFSGGGRVTIEVAGSVYGPVDRFDHPVASLVGVGLAATLDQPVSLDVTPAEDGPADYFVTCEWDADGVESTK